MFWEAGFAVLRAPASGGGTVLPRPDLIAGSVKRNKFFVLEIKTARKDALYIDEDPISGESIDYLDVEIDDFLNKYPEVHRELKELYMHLIRCINKIMRGVKTGIPLRPYCDQCPSEKLSIKGKS